MLFHLHLSAGITDICSHAWLMQHWALNSELGLGRLRRLSAGKASPTWRTKLQFQIQSSSNLKIFLGQPDGSADKALPAGQAWWAEFNPQSQVKMEERTAPHSCPSPPHVPCGTHSHTYRHTHTHTEWETKMKITLKPLWLLIKPCLSQANMVAYTCDTSTQEAEAEDYKSRTAWVQDPQLKN